MGWQIGVDIGGTDCVFLNSATGHALSPVPRSGSTHMRIDCEMHIGAFQGDPYVWLGHPVGPKELEAILDAHGLDMAVVMAPTE